MIVNVFCYYIFLLYIANLQISKFAKIYSDFNENILQI